MLLRSYFEIIEGRMQGDIRHKVAQAIRDKKVGKDSLTELQRATKERLVYDAQAGDIVLGRHTYKEYIRGFHEGYLGPTSEPEAITSIMNPHMPGDPITEAPLVDESLVNTDPSPPEPPVEKTDEEIKAEIDAIKAKIPSSPPSYILPDEYAAAQLNTNPPTTSFTYVPMQHLLGFLNTPWRIYRFLNRRSLAEDMCRATTAAVLASHTRTFDETRDLEYGIDEQMDWPKKNRQKEDGVWVESITTDRRVVEALQVYQYEEPVTAGEQQASGEASTA
ncbi:Mitochondrial import inner membrane translocase subunit tim-54 [Taphrina deformans PYCC 5710]|uniref:Mitochondrial import inner membrane translocase subunit TIM54 n=1 Tax=Taphrina deformans (strain PYCC 5710 / ATCC 11124 / CBS 356.35 / IMI 108563 / JCM 9778 / NBRC 8474) TaxID=1097556 RepID=R4X9P8_TAPDE|nr:Mitochondrial import inner membrane translocase subunit tim-54 [Taphrina deformans PYCC 5710]|eukprot:CCG82491.1 Mitochondrial import inner membrane translocase subunit tim-54 [Taphrina deformans PYCC 5710]